jgi:hypothetical protein
VPLLGVLALGAEAGSWYVTKQQAQNAADAAAYAGALWLVCNQNAACADTTAGANGYIYRGKEFAAQNGFCNAGDTSYPGSRCPSGTSQLVTIAPIGSTEVQATVSQTQPTILVKLLGIPTVTIGATAIAQVSGLSAPCVLSLQDPLQFQGSTTIQSPNCGLQSNNTSTGAITFTGNGGINVSDVASFSALGGCTQTGGTECSNAITYLKLPTPDPLSALNTAMLNVSIPTQCPSGNNVLPTAYATSPCVNAGFTFKSNGGPNNGTYALNGVYFFSGTLKMQGSPTITGTAALILLPGTGSNAPQLKMDGTTTIQLTGPASVSTSQVPAALASVVTNPPGLMNGLVIYDPETQTQPPVSISGNTTSFLTGITYAPNADIIYGGSTQSSSCTAVIAKGVQFSGNSNFDDTTCPASIKNNQTKIVTMVQ